MMLSIVIPCLNEKNNLPLLLKKIEAVDLGGVKKEIIIVDDYSTDGTREFLEELEKTGAYKMVYHDRNRGKGAALLTGFAQVTGDMVLIQDADLEYDPQDYPALIAPIIKKEYQVVYGSRERNPANRTHSGVLFYLGGRFLSIITNLLYGSKLTDEATCYKVFEAKLLLSLPLKCQRFEFCPEVTARVLKKGIPIKEVSIAYFPRTSKEGKKIRYSDGLEAIWTLIKYRFID